MVQAEDIKDERCSCGHLKSEHYPSSYHIGGNLTPLKIGGHGRCSKCNCTKFTFTDWVGKDGKDIEL